MTVTALPYLHNLSAKEAQAEPLTANSPSTAAVQHDVFVGLSQATIDTAATAGANGAPPATVGGYVEVAIGGSLRKIAFYEF